MAQELFLFVHVIALLSLWIKDMGLLNLVVDLFKRKMVADVLTDIAAKQTTWILVLVVATSFRPVLSLCILAFFAFLWGLLFGYHLD